MGTAKELTAAQRSTIFFFVTKRNWAKMLWSDENLHPGRAKPLQPDVARAKGQMSSLLCCDHCQAQSQPYALGLLLVARFGATCAFGRIGYWCQVHGDGWFQEDNARPHKAKAEEASRLATPFT